MGVVIFEMATGRLPFAGASPSETVANVLDRDPVPVRSLNPNRPATLDAIVQRLLAKGADERYQSATELLEALKKLTEKIPWRRLFGR
jgi:serine/threonine-protein kinase